MSLLTEPEEKKFKEFTIKPGSVDEHGIKLDEIFKHHWEITGKKIFKRDLNYSLDSYRHLEKLNALVGVAAVDANNQIVGYIVGHCAPHLFMMDEKFVTIELFYVKEDLRKTGLAKAMLDYTEQYVGETLGATHICIGLLDPVKHLARFFKQTGYSDLQATVYKRIL